LRSSQLLFFSHKSTVSIERPTFPLFFEDFQTNKTKFALAFGAFHVFASFEMLNWSFALRAQSKWWDLFDNKRPCLWIEESKVFCGVVILIKILEEFTLNVTTGTIGVLIFPFFEAKEAKGSKFAFRVRTMHPFVVLSLIHHCIFAPRALLRVTFHPVLIESFS
jgi:hypothetical protein